MSLLSIFEPLLSENSTTFLVLTLSPATEFEPQGHALGPDTWKFQAGNATLQQTVLGKKKGTFYFSGKKTGTFYFSEYLDKGVRGWKNCIRAKNQNVPFSSPDVQGLSSSQMYSVIRFSGRPEQLDSVGHSVNPLFPDSFDGLDHVPGRFSCTISESDEWGEQRDTQIDWLRRLHSVLESAKDAGIRVSIDLAVYPEVYQARWLTELSLDQTLIELLHRYRVNFVVSVYGPI
jgi:hypothetical protein